MRKLILSLLIFCSVLLQAQIQIPQVVGLPSALAGKEAKLPSTPPNPESRFLNGNKQWAEIVLGSGGYASNVYFTNLTSTIVGSYKQTSGTHELTETIASGTCNNNEVLIHTYLFEQPVGITTVDAGAWRFTMNCAISSNVGDSKFKIVQFRRSSTGVETDMFTIYSNTIENTDYQNFIIETVQPSFLVDSLDRFGCRIYATTTTTVNKIISYKVGDGFASYLNTPLALRHPQLRDPNGNPNVQHLTAAQVTKVNNTIGINTGDETLTSIKTKLGAASSVSDGYLRYQDFALLHTPTTVTASNGLSISGQNISLQDASLTQSGALTFNDYNRFDSKEPAITKNSGFNLPLGTTSGTVLEGRTFGTAANSAVGDFQPIENQRLSTTNSPSFTSITSTAATGTAPLIVNSTTMVSNLNSEYLKNMPLTSTGNNFSGVVFVQSDGVIDAGKYIDLHETNAGTEDFTNRITSSGSGNLLLNGNNIYHAGNLTNALTTNYIPKWNGSSMVNATAGTDYQLPITLTTNGTSGAATFENGVMNVPNYGSNATGGSYSPSISVGSNTANPVVYSALYTKNGTVYSSVIKGYIECTGSQGNTCTFNVSTYNGSTANLSIIGVGAQGTNMIIGSGSTGSNVVVSFTNPVGSGGIGFTLIVHYTN